jgi:hypothetical protein
MSHYHIDIDVNNPAFGDGPGDENIRDNQVARILEDLALNLKAGAFYNNRPSITLRDRNGNIVGQVELQQN